MPSMVKRCSSKATSGYETVRIIISISLATSSESKWLSFRQFSATRHVPWMLCLGLQRVLLSILRHRYYPLLNPVISNRIFTSIDIYTIERNWDHYDSFLCCAPIPDSICLVDIGLLAIHSCSNRSFKSTSSCAVGNTVVR